MAKLFRQIPAFAVCLLILTLSHYAFAASFSQRRFNDSITDLKQSFEGLSKSNSGFAKLSELDQAKALLKSGVRVKAFNLQSLGRLYLRYPKTPVAAFAKKVLADSKALEDALGQFDMYSTVKRKTRAEAAAAELMKLVRDQQWLDEKNVSAHADALLASLEDLSWETAVADRAYILGQIAQQLRAIDAADYDMTKLNGGMHELRRDLRWIPIYSLALGGLIQKSNSGKFACEQSTLNFKEFVDVKYSTLPKPPRSVEICYVSQCLFDEVAGAVSFFGSLKDDAEGVAEHDKEMLKADSNPEEIAAKAKKYYDALKDSGVLAQLSQQIKSCR